MLVTTEGGMRGSRGTRAGAPRGLIRIILLAVCLLASIVAYAAIFGSRPPGPRPHLDRLTLAKIAFAERRWDAAEAILRDLASTDHPSGDLARLLGQVLLEQGRAQEAREQFAESLKGNPGDAAALLGMARALRAVGSRELALGHLERALKTAPRDASLWKELGVLQRDLGDLAGALGALQRSLSIDPRQDEVSTLLAELGTQSPEAWTGTPRPAAIAAPGFGRSSILPDPRPKVPSPADHFPRPPGRTP